MKNPFIKKIYSNGLLEFESYTFPLSYLHIGHHDVKSYENVKQVVVVNGQAVYELTTPVITKYTKDRTEWVKDEETNKLVELKSVDTFNLSVEEQGITCIWYPIKKMTPSISRGTWFG